MKNYFTSEEKAPYHISVGAVVINDENKVLCHYYEEPKIRNYPPHFYTLMHETIEPGESLEETVHRGLREEFSIKGEIVRFIGSLVVPIVSKKWNSNVIEKTVVYFLCKLSSIDEVRDLTDPESISEIKWLDIDELIAIMEKQGREYSPSADESKVLRSVKAYVLE